jgi:mannose-6-phosphate isomerase-like protein (cupin superfamily)
MNNNKINFNNKYSKFLDLWTPKIIAEMNDYQIKLVKINGDFLWHSHDNTDEVFIVLDGSMEIRTEEKLVKLDSGEMYVVPKGVLHKPYAEKECKIMIIEPKGVLNTGNKKNSRTSKNDVWI